MEKSYYKHVVQLFFLCCDATLASSKVSDSDSHLRTYSDFFSEPLSVQSKRSALKMKWLKESIYLIGS